MHFEVLNLKTANTRACFESLEEAQSLCSELGEWFVVVEMDSDGLAVELCD